MLNPQASDWRFFLVFHLGFVLYLMLHNLGVPAFIILGTHSFAWHQWQLWFIPELALLYGILKNKITWIGPLVLLNHFIAFLSLIHLVYLMKNLGPSKLLFTYCISNLSFFFFLLGYHIKFKRIFPFNFQHRSFILSFLLATILVSYHFLIFESVIPSNKNSSLPIQHSLVHYNDFYWHDIIKGSKSTIIDLNGIQNPSIPIYLDKKNKKGWSIENKMGKNIHLRVEKMNNQNERWIFKKLLILKNKEKSRINDLEDGVYRIFSPTHSKWQKQFVFINIQNSLKEMNYKL